MVSMIGFGGCNPKTFCPVLSKSLRVLQQQLFHLRQALLRAITTGPVKRSTKGWVPRVERKGKERKGKERKGKERKGKERKGKERRGEERRGEERKGEERKGKERKGKEEMAVMEGH